MTPTRITGDLIAVLARLEPLIVDDGAARANIREQARAERLERLHREQIALRPDVEDALARGGDELAETSSMRVTRSWLSSSARKPVLVLSGGTGLGKTVAAAYAVATSAHGGHWRSAARILRTFSALYGRAVDDQELCRECYLLVIDDLGAEPEDDRMTAALIELMESRKRGASRNRTIVTTNMDPAAFKSRYPEPRLLSRMRECAQWASVDGEDLRAR